MIQPPPYGQSDNGREPEQVADGEAETHGGGLKVSVCPKKLRRGLVTLLVAWYRNLSEQSEGVGLRENSADLLNMPTFNRGKPIAV
jgi:hypothetical protein